MKTTSLIVILLVITNSLFAQESKKIDSKIVPINIEGKEKSRTINTVPSVQNKSVTISKKAGEPQRVHDANYYQEEIAKIDAQILAINTKIQLIQNDPVENKLATQNGWYTDMENIKDKLNAQKIIYQQKLNQ